MPNLDTAELVFLPLGGCGEIGMNLNAYGYGPRDDRRWILVDLGVTFGDDSTPGVDLICANPQFLEDNSENIEAIFLTHAHEDHIGAVGLLWPRLRAPLYATPFTAHLVAGKLAERGLGHVDVNVVPLEGEVDAGPFRVTYVTLTHSIPEPNALAIKTPAGTILHTGDWKIDPDPLIGEGVDVDGLRRLGDEGVLAMICDSTNVFVDGESGSEATVRHNMVELIESLSGRVAVATFASNVARVATVIEAARKSGRSVCLAGRSMHKIVDAAVQTGVLKDLPDLVDEADASSFPADNILYLCTGSQGEERAALGRIANGTHRHLTLGAGDTAIFSSRVIPGNEKSIFEMQNVLADRGVRIITDRMSPKTIHVSGHPARDELERMYNWVRPRIAVPVHGERRHIMEHAAFARSMQVPEAVTPRNGDLVRLWPGKAECIDVVPSGRLHLDGSRLVPAGSEGLGERIAISRYGYVTASIALDEDGSIADGPYIASRGLSEEDGRLADESLYEIEAACDEALDGLSRRKRLDDEVVETVLVRTIKRNCERVFGRKPLVDVTILRV